jgi:hypothetical protein
MQATREGRTPAQIWRAIDAKYVRGNAMPTRRPPDP